MNTQIIYTVKCESYAQGNNCPGVTKFTNLITQGTAGRIYSDIHIHATFIKHTHTRNWLPHSYQFFILFTHVETVEDTSTAFHI